MAAIALAQAHDNVLVTRTFSKIYGLAGERVGWGLGAPGIIDALNRIRGPFNVTLSGQAAALAALDDQDFVAPVARGTMPPSARVSSPRSRRWATTAFPPCRARPISCWCCSKAR